MNEQERAERLAQDIERLMAGELLSGGDPLLDLARTLGQGSVQPGPQASARFEQQINQWFHARAAPVPRHAPVPVLTVAVTMVVIVVIVAGLLVVGPLIVPTSTPTPTDTPTLTPSPTSTPTDTPTPVEATTSPTPLAFSRIVVSGRIESIQDNSIVVLGQSIKIDGSLGRWCVGDLVRVEVSVRVDGTYSASRDSVTVETGTCPPVPTTHSQPPPPVSSGGGQPDHHHEGDD